MVSVTSASRYITSASCYHPRYQSRFLYVYPWSDSTEFRRIGRGSSDCTVWSVFAVRSVVTCSLRLLSWCRLRRLCSDWADAWADMDFLVTHINIVGFPMSWHNYVSTVSKCAPPFIFSQIFNRCMPSVLTLVICQLCRSRCNDMPNDNWLLVWVSNVRFNKGHIQQPIYLEFSVLKTWKGMFASA